MLTQYMCKHVCMYLSIHVHINVYIFRKEILDMIKSEEERF